MNPQRPNILCLVMDQLRWDCLGCYGNDVIRTPNLDRLASRGVVFDRAYVVNPLCMPARATFFTGRTPRGHRVRTNGIPLDPAVPTLTEALRQAGYHTHAVGKIHLLPQPTPLAGEGPLDLSTWPESYAAWERGDIHAVPSPYYGLESAKITLGHGHRIGGDYGRWIRREHPDAIPQWSGEIKREDWQARCGGETAYKSALPETLHYNRWIADRTCEFLHEKKADGRPFFCWSSFPDPHHPYIAPAPYCDWYDPGAMPDPIRREGELDNLPSFYKIVHNEGAVRHWGGLSGRDDRTDLSRDAIRHIRALTYAMISCVDAAIGRILNYLEETGLGKNTAICFLSDHGDMLGDHGLLNKGPFHFEGLLRMPMIWSFPGRFAAGVRTSGLASQLDFAPTVLDLCGVETPEGRAPVEPVCRRQRPALPGHSLVPVLRGQAGHVRNWVIVENDEDYLGTNLRTFITDRYKITVYTGREAWGEIFDLREDPDETRNLWSDPASAPLKAELLATFFRCYLEEESPHPRRLAHA